ncbi:hypothetical protein G9A89_004799 [Geosiphon pyriformis]|nr:hypothetical protein G9A89_004799 [Geosiphon pyriformis]
MEKPGQNPDPRPIVKLEEIVVNRIAAGEIIHRPANALKELIENSLDAGSTSIQILVKEGGLKLLQIHDNGHGIRKEDMAIVCERFTTSKLKRVEDLATIGTYGFRGEALASITHVAHVTITTKTSDSSCAYRGHYSNGKLVPPKPGASNEPKPCAGNTGTQITVEDLFYNIPTRRKAMKNSSEEYNKILDVVNRYAIHNAGISFGCKKQGSNQPDVQTLSNASILDNIRQVYGGSTASELLEISKEYRKLEFRVKGYISNANYHVKKIGFLLFINHRAVENSRLKKTIESIYATYLPKQTHPFVYLSLNISSKNVDVNVHPTKSEVHFLYENEIIAKIGDAIQTTLAGASSSRSFLTQTLLPGAPLLGDLNQDDNHSLANSKSVRDCKLVRTDSRTRTLDKFFTPEDILTSIKRARIDTTIGNDLIGSTTKSLHLSEESSKLDRRLEWKDTRLLSILTLRNRLKEARHQGLADLLANHTLVGCVDDNQGLALVQYQTKLFLLNYKMLSEELFYQLILQEFSNFGHIQLSRFAPIRELILLALDQIENEELMKCLKSKEQIAEIINGQLIQQRDMLGEYFSMTITETGKLTTLPLIIKGYVPNLEKLPNFLLRLGTEVDWTTEIVCFEILARELGRFYATEPPNIYNDVDEILHPSKAIDFNDAIPMDICQDPKGKQKERHDKDITNPNHEERASLEKYKWQVEHLIFPAFRSNFDPPKSIAESRQIVQIADLPALYRIFERC